jgi:hypothetical protein
MKKNTYSLGDLACVLLACNRRHLAHLATPGDFSAGARRPGRVTQPRNVHDKTVVKWAKYCLSSALYERLFRIIFWFSPGGQVAQPALLQASAFW